MRSKRKFILYDSRACGNQCTDDASIFVLCDTDEEAHSYDGDYGAMACYSYLENSSGDYVDEKWEWDYLG